MFFFCTSIIKEKGCCQKGLMNKAVAENFSIFLYKQNSNSNYQIILPLFQPLPQINQHIYYFH